MTVSNETSPDTLSKIPKDLSSNILYTHSRINDNTSKALKSTSFVYTLIEFLIKKWLLTTEELDDHKRQVAERFVYGIITETMNITLS
jgi:hypothetical protein